MQNCNWTLCINFSERSNICFGDERTVKLLMIYNYSSVSAQKNLHCNLRTVLVAPGDYVRVCLTFLCSWTRMSYLWPWEHVSLLPLQGKYVKVAFSTSSSIRMFLMGKNVGKLTWSQTHAHSRKIETFFPGDFPASVSTSVFAVFFYDALLPMNRVGQTDDCLLHVYIYIKLAHEYCMKISWSRSFRITRGAGTG
jgi:hypothetical protein